MTAFAPALTPEISSIDPRTGELVAVCADMSDEQVAATITRARAAADAWATTSLASRARHLREIRRRWVRSLPELARIDARETGKSVIDATQETLAAVGHLEWCSWNLHRGLRSRRVSTFPAVLKRARTEYSPLGVIGLIAPWNYPAFIPMQIIPWAIAAGNTIVLKPSELTSQTGLLLADIVNSAGIDLVHIVTGGPAVGAALASSPGIDKLAFTGSGPTAVHVLRSAAEHLTPAVLELGGNDALIVTDGADVDVAARAAVGAAFINAGQTCVATERVIATPGVYDAVLERLQAATRELVVGPDDRSHVGPLTMPGAIDRVVARIEEAIRGGATALVGGSALAGTTGDYLEPTILVDVPPDAEILTEENFAPVLCVVRALDEDDAIAIANSVKLGLAASVFAATPDQARRIASRLDTGGVVLGDATIGPGLASVPFGGVKGSGYGRLGGIEGFRDFSRSRAVIESRFGPAVMPLISYSRPSAEGLQASAEALLGGGSLGHRVRLVRRARKAFREARRG